MGLLKILKAIVGLGSTGAQSGTAGTSDEDVDVAVREPEPDTASEDAVKGTEETEPEVDTADESEDEGEAESAEPEVDTADESEDADVDAAEEADDETVQDTITEESDEGSEDEVEEVPDDLAADPDESTEVISGIGPSYAGRLAEAGIETVADLAAADPADVADRSDLSEKRVSRWVASARGEDE